MSALVQIKPPKLRSDQHGPPPAIPAGNPGLLTDRSARQVDYLRVSLTDRCNFRCTYCMPETPLTYGPRKDILSLEEVALLCRGFARWGVERVRLTGGEPTIRRGLVGLVGELSSIPTATGRLDVVMTTNAERLAELAEPLAAAGLGSLTVSIDSLDAGQFRRITRRGNLDRVIAGIEAAVRAGLGPVKTNTVALRGFNDNELGALAEFAWQRGVTPRFIELMPMSGGALFVPGEMMSAAEVRATISETLGLELEPDDGTGVRGRGPATYWRVRGGQWSGHRLGTIGAMTENFCASCNRLRISATGQLHGCLARDDTGDLRTAVRSGEARSVEAVVRAVLGDKRDAHGFETDGSGGPTKAMISIGG